jgi:A/G-specific adenine glycosylase
VSHFASALVTWQRLHGRHGLPWQRTRDPYRIWLSEVMLQQTQVAAVVPYYERFMARFPHVETLACASLDEVLVLWSGLGYYARARNLLAAARQIARGGGFPKSVEAIAELPGVGRSTAAAIAAFAFGRRAAILDGNVKRVLARCFGVAGWPGERTVERQLWSLAERLLPERRIRAYTQALMDLGATVCLRAKPLCAACPVKTRCVAFREQRVHELPAARPRRALPRRTATWALLWREGRVLLERRAPTGLWGGLWSFPEVSRRQLASQCEQRYGCEVGTMRELPALEHGFTHFRLRVRPILCEVARQAPRAASEATLWVDLAQQGSPAMPAPVKRLFDELADLAR